MRILSYEHLLWQYIEIAELVGYNLENPYDTLAEFVQRQNKVEKTYESTYKSRYLDYAKKLADVEMALDGYSGGKTLLQKVEELKRINKKRKSQLEDAYRKINET